jgi:protein O-mannosyl-transferase
MNAAGLKDFVASRRSGLVCLLLALVTSVVYGQVAGFEFTNFDEFTMILKNPFVLAGLTWQGLWWGLTSSWFEYWHPVTWWSHMLDCELFGLSAGWHHLVSLGFHVANTLLLFVVLERMTGAWKRSAMVAALFALHPLHVESVAWVAERKDLLSAFFFMLTLWAYVRNVECRMQNAESRMKKQETEHPTSNIQHPIVRVTHHASRITFHVSRFYVLSLFFFALGLMSKPMVVTLPFVLLLLDYWPLRRFQPSTISHQLSTLRQLIWEKAPFFALTIASCAITYHWALTSGNTTSAEKEPWSLRLETVPVSYTWYLWKMIWPADMVAQYPMPSHWAWWQVGGAVLVLAIISLWVVLRARSAPYGIVGWLLFLGVLFPTIRLVQAGYQSIADRYTYIPSIGIFIAVVWAAAEWGGARSCRSEAPLGSKFDVFPRRPVQAQAARSLPTKPDRAALLTGAALVVLLLCGYVTWIQTGYWRNGFRLWTHCLAVFPDNSFARYNLGYVLQHSGKTSEAIEQYWAALRLKPDHPDANLNLGIALIGSSRAQEATNYLAAAVRIKPDFARAQGALGLALYVLGDYTGAVAHCAEAIRLDPETFGPYVDMGRALSAQGKSDEALRYYAEGLRLNPGLAQTHYYLGLEWMKRRAFEQAETSFSDAVRLAPGWAEARAQQQHALNEARKLHPDLDEHKSPTTE